MRPQGTLITGSNSLIGGGATAPFFYGPLEPQDNCPSSAVVNIVAQKSVTNENSVLERSMGSENMKKRRLFCRKGLPELQQGRCCIAARPPSHDDSGPVATPGGPYGRTNPDIFTSKDVFSVL